MKLKELKQIIREELGKKKSLIPDSYFNLYVANQDTELKTNNNKKISIPKGTVISATGGGNWKSEDGKIKTEENKLKDNPNFTVVNDMTWPTATEVSDQILDWARGKKDYSNLSIEQIKKAMDSNIKTLNSIKKLLK